MKNIFFIWLMVLVISFLSFVGRVSATSSNLELNYPGQPGPLFSETNWAPGSTATKTISVTNNTDISQDFGIKISELIGDTNLAGVLTVQIKKDSNILVGKHLSDLLDETETFIDVIPPHTTTNFDITVTMDDVGNEYQGLTVETANLLFGFIQKGEVLGVKTGQVLGAAGSDIKIIAIFSLLVALIIWPAWQIYTFRRYSKR
jgi:hypothetical protein